MLSDNSVEGEREFMPGTIESESNALVDELIAASREIGGDPRLVLQGGGNTSAKVGWRDVTLSVSLAVRESTSGPRGLNHPMLEPQASQN